MEGGYQIIDLKNKALAGTSVSMPGIYELIKGTKKPLLVQNVVIYNGPDKVEFRDFFCSPIIEMDAYTLDDIKQNISITVSDDDTVVGYTSSTWMISPYNIPINNTLEVDGDGELGVASN